jgi:hypothetical protein
MRRSAIHNYSDELPARIVIKFHDDIHLPDLRDIEIKDYFLKSHILSQNLLKQFPSIHLEKLFTTLKPEKIAGIVEKARKQKPSFRPNEFLNYYVVLCPAEVDAVDVLKVLTGCKKINHAYLETGSASPPFSPSCQNPLSKNQGYLKAAPCGIDAAYAWQFDGGDGDGKINFIDIEQGWIPGHEDIDYNTYPDTGINKKAFEDHGSAVLGIIMMRDNKKGGIGITPYGQGNIVSQWRPCGSFNTADAIMTAISHLAWGDILLLQSQGFDSPGGFNAWPAEIQRAVFDVIQLATASGISVIEPAGNGNLYSQAGNDLDRFLSKRKRILNPQSGGFRDSGAIIVAAATSLPPHRKIGCSNYGNRVDCYAWGENVVTAGNYPASSGKAVNPYTTCFGGTSAASAIVAGAAVAVQSIAEANLGFRLSPEKIRNVLSNNALGTTSANGRSNDKIGVMPDLKKVIDKILGVKIRLNPAEPFERMQLQKIQSMLPMQKKK